MRTKRAFVEFFFGVRRKTNYLIMYFELEFVKNLNMLNFAGADHEQFLCAADC